MVTTSLLITRSRIAFATSVIALIGAIAAGGARVALSESKLESVDKRTKILEGESEARALEIERISTTLDDLKATLGRIENRVDAMPARGDR